MGCDLLFGKTLIDGTSYTANSTLYKNSIRRVYFVEGLQCPTPKGAFKYYVILLGGGGESPKRS